MLQRLHRQISVDYYTIPPATQARILSQFFFVYHGREKSLSWVIQRTRKAREKPWLGKTNSGARLFDSGSLFRFVSNTFQPGFFFTSTLWKIFILVSCNGSVSRFVPRWRLKDSLPEAPVLHKAIVIFQAWTTCGHIFLFDNAVFLALVFICRCRRMHQEKAT